MIKTHSGFSPEPSGSASLTADGTPDAVIELEEVWKTYRVVHTPLDHARYLLNPGGGEQVAALSGITLRVQRGEAVGLLGKNGAGKSTLLRVVAGIAPATRGSVRVEGSVYPLLDLKAGLNPFLSGRRNVYQRLGLLGLTRPEIDARVEPIKEFSELGDAFEEPMFMLSTGMRIRLAFSIAAVVDPEVLLVDEVLSVGDGFFVAKSFRRIQEMSKGGQATLVASHDWGKTFRLCDRIVWLEGGAIKAEGSPSELMHDYFKDLNAFKISGEVKILEVGLLGADGEPRDRLRPGESMTLRVEYEVPEGSRSFCILAAWMHAGNGETVLSAYSPDDGFVVTDAVGRGAVEIEYPALPLAPGPYDASVLLVDPSHGPFAKEFLAVWGPIERSPCRVVFEGPPSEALLELPVQWSARHLEAE